MFKNSKLKIKNYLAFTLIELLVVISIIGILATLVAANLNSARSRARDVERKSDLKNISTALRLYFNDNGKYPAAGSMPWGSQWASSTGTVYMNVLPQDPQNPTQTYSYQATPALDSFTLTACLENKSDVSCKSSVVINGWSCPTDCAYQVQP